MITLFQLLGNSWLFVYVAIQFFALVGFLVPEKTQKIEKKPSVSFIVSVWNEGPRIKRCVDSLLRQHYEGRIEIIVVGGGTDNTEKICRKLSKENKIKYIFEKKRRGKWFSLNRAIKIAKNDILAFVDGDCTVGKHWTKNIISKINDSDVVVSCRPAMTERTFLGKTTSVLMLFIFYLAKNISKFINVSAFFGFGGVVKKRVFKKIKFKKSLVEDWRFCSDAIKKRFKIGFASDVLTYSAPVKTLKDFRNQILRCSYGFNSELLLKKDFFITIVLIESLLLAVGIPFYVYNLMIRDYFTLIISVITFMLLVLFLFIISLKQGSLKYVLFLPHLMFFFIFLTIMNLEALVRVLFKHSFGWPILKKISK